jgi:toxin ParE1/3/4
VKTFALTSKAKADLRAIAIFTEERWGKEQRNLYIKQFDDAFHMLANAPLAGKACGYIKNGLNKKQEGKRGQAQVLIPSSSGHRFEPFTQKY